MHTEKRRFILIIGIGTLLCAYLALGLYGIVNSNSLNDLYEASYKNSMLEGTYTVSAYGNILNIENALKDALISDDVSDIRAAMNEVNEYSLQVQADFSRLRSVDGHKFEKNSGLFEIIVSDFSIYEQQKDEAYTKLNDGDISQFKHLISNKISESINAIAIKLKTLVEGENDEVRDAYVSYKNVTSYTQFQMIIGVILLFSFGIYITFTVRKSLVKSKEKLHIEKEELRITIDAIGEGVIVTDVNRHIIKLNKVAEELTQWTTKEAYGKLLDEVFIIMDEMSDIKEISPIQLVLDKDIINIPETDTILISKMGQQRFISASASLIKDLYGKTTGAVLIFRDITERRRKEEEINYITYHDQVTQLYNRSFFEEQKIILDQEEYLPVSVIQGDINGLKLVNDAFGHAKGDELLREAAELLKKHCRKFDYISRVGGDEFTILLPNTTIEEANKIIKRIEDDLRAQENESEVNTFFISIALGAATKNKSSETISAVIKKADESMYKKKLLEKKSLHNSVLKSIKSTLAEKSHETEAHATRLIELSSMIGKELELPVEKLYELELLATLHDIGKIGISDQILNKPGPLTNEEWIEMKKHPEIGYRIAFSTSELSGIAKYILCHHERWDGKGYPQELEGTNIPLISRIISVVDAYDAMCDQRSYNIVRTKEEALFEIEKNAGKQFDPDITKIFVTKMRESDHR